MTTYTIVDNSGEAIRSGLTLLEAASLVLTDDSREYQLRQDEDGYWRVWSRQQVANRPWRPLIYGSWADTETEAWLEIAEKVVDDSGFTEPGNFFPEVMTDEAYGRMIAGV